MNKAKKKSQVRTKLFLPAVLALLLLFLLYNTAQFAAEYDRSSKRHYEFSDFYASFQNGEYISMKRMAAVNETNHYETSYDTSEFKIFADFYEQCLLAYAYTATGEEKQAEQYRQAAAASKAKLTHYLLYQRAGELEEKYSVK